jgi:hypothetical protein
VDASRNVLIGLLLLVGACAQLKPGISTESDVLAKMGRPDDTVALADGGRILWYSRPAANSAYGAENYAATIGADGKLASLEQRLAPEYVAKLVPGQSRAEDVRRLIGPPQRKFGTPGKPGETWEYQAPPQGFAHPVTVYVELSPEEVVTAVSAMERASTTPSPASRK